MKIEYERAGEYSTAKIDGTPDEVAAFVSAFQDEKIDFTNFLRRKTRETDPVKIALMELPLLEAVKRLGIPGEVSCVYYTDGCIRVSIDGRYYKMFNSVTGRFFSGYPGD